MAIQAECLCKQWRTELRAININLGRLRGDLSKVERKIAAEKAKDDPNEKILSELTAERTRLLGNIERLENQQRETEEQLSNCAGADCNPT